MTGYYEGISCYDKYRQDVYENSLKNTQVLQVILSSRKLICNSFELLSNLVYWAISRRYCLIDPIYVVRP